jgi:hypothetical protein
MAAAVKWPAWCSIYSKEETSKIRMSTVVLEQFSTAATGISEVPRNTRGNGIEGRCCHLDWRTSGAQAPNKGAEESKELDSALV